MVEKKLIEFALRKSLFYPTAEIYSNAIAGFYDFGHYGSIIRRRLINYWLKELVRKEGFIECFGNIILPEDVFIASGHIKNFNDPLTQCEKCHSLFRADNLLEDHININFPEGMPSEEFDKLIKEHNLKCPKCEGSLSKVRKFNLLMKTMIGALNDIPGYLRGEACQNIFLNFNRLYKTVKQKLPLGIAQPGFAFRNEINPRNNLLRGRSFGQMDVEVFFNPKKINEFSNFNEVKDYKLNLMLLGQEVKTISCSEAVEEKIVSGQLIAYLLARVQQFYESLGIPVNAMRFRELGDDEKAFYAKETWDFEVLVENRFIELVACNYRSDFDLKSHSELSKKDLRVTEDNEKFFPHIFELSAGIDRSFVAMLVHTMKEREDKRNYLDLRAEITPVQFAILPLVKKDGLAEIGKKLFNELKSYNFLVVYEDNASIGKRYSRLDEIGCNYCLTIDHQTKENQTITIRERNSMKQKRIPMQDCHLLLFELINGKKNFKEL